MTIERTAGQTASAVGAETRRAAHPRECRGCRHEQVLGKYRFGDLLGALNGYCMAGMRQWPDGCYGYAERAK